jgi:hypothetical protein
LGDKDNYFFDRYTKYGTANLILQAVVTLKTDDGADSHAPTTSGELRETGSIGCGIL